MASFTSRPLSFRGKNPRVEFDRKVGWPEGRSGPDSEDKNSRREPNLNSPVVQHTVQSLC
jgi:hypothetical protein